MLTAMLLMGACTATSQREVGSDPRLPQGTIDTIEPGSDAAEEIAKANTIRDRLEAEGIECQGTAGPPGTDNQVSLGVAAQMDCPYDAGEIQIVVYRTSKAKTAGLDRLAWLACMGGWKAEYVDGDVWVVGTVLDGKNESDPAMTERITSALDAPAAALSC